MAKVFLVKLSSKDCYPGTVSYNVFFITSILDGVRAHPILDGGGKKAPHVNSAIQCLTTMKLSRNVV